MVEPEDVTAFTAEANQAMLDQDRLDPENKEDWEDAQKGFIARATPGHPGPNGKSRAIKCIAHRAQRPDYG